MNCVFEFFDLFFILLMKINFIATFLVIFFEKNARIRQKMQKKL